jgi:hypothetical protein
MSAKIQSWLIEAMYEIEKAKGVVPVAEMDKRAAAFKEVFTAPTPTQLREAMTTAHFSTYFTTVLDREFITNYEVQQGTWKQYTFADTAPDFRNVERYHMETYLPLVLRREKAESKAGYIHQDRPFYYAPQEYSGQMDVSWRTLLNDDLGKIKQELNALSNSAAAFEDQFVSAAYDNATTQAGLVALGAAYAGTGRLTAANLAIGINAMMSRTTPITGLPMNVRKIFLVIPPILKLQADTILGSALMAGVATNDKNVLPGYIARVFTDPYIATAAPNVPWYLFADPSAIRAVSVLRLAGAPGPITYMKEPEIRILSGGAPAGFDSGSFATGDIEYAVSDFIGVWGDATFVGVTDVRGIYYSSGTTP